MEKWVIVPVSLLAAVILFVYLAESAPAAMTLRQRRNGTHRIRVECTQQTGTLSAVPLPQVSGW